MEYVFVVDDNGHSHHKLAYFQDGEIKTLKEPAIVGDGSKPITDTAGNPQETYLVGDRKFCCHSQVRSKIDTRNESYQVSDENKALVAHVVSKAELEEVPLIMGVTLPWRDAFKSTGEVDGQRMVRVANHYTEGDITNLSNGKAINLVKVKPYVEGLAAFYDWAIDDEGSLERCAQTVGPVAVIDIGGSTTDIVTVLAGDVLTIDHSRSNTKKIGVLDAKAGVQQSLSEAIRTHTGVNPDLDEGIPEWMVERAMKTGKINFGNSGEIDIQAALEAANKNAVEQIISFVKTTIGNPLGYEAIIFVGGGAIMFGDELKERFPQSFLLDEFANARGALKYMIKLDRESLMTGVGG